MKKARETAERTINLLKKDKLRLPDEFIGLLTGDASELLSHYFELSEPFAKIKIDVDEDGRYVIRLIAKAERPKDIPICLPLIE